MVRFGKGFTLIELLIAFSISTVLLGAIYFFYIGFVRTGEQTKHMAFLNMVVDNKLEIVTRDLRTAVEIVDLHPHQLRFRRHRLPEGELTPLELEMRRLETVEFRIVSREGHQVFLRQIGFGEPEELFRVREIGDEVFRGYELILDSEGSAAERADDDSFPRFRVFDTLTQSSLARARIPLIRLLFDIQTPNDALTIQSRVFLPLVYARIIEPDWNLE